MKRAAEHFERDTFHIAAAITEFIADDKPLMNALVIAWRVSRSAICKDWPTCVFDAPTTVNTLLHACVVDKHTVHGSKLSNAIVKLDGTVGVPKSTLPAASLAGPDPAPPSGTGRVTKGVVP